MPNVEVDSRKVFVIHGRNEPARKGLFDFLRSIGLAPIEWTEAITMTGSASPYIGDVLDAAFGSAQAIVVLQTPDDVVHLHESLTYPGDPETKPQMQPRPNVLFEAGMAMGRNPNRTVIVELGQVKNFSDIHGRHVVKLDNSVKQRQALATRLRDAKCAVNLDGSDWHEAGDLTPPSPPGGGLPLGRKLPSSETAGRPRLTAELREKGGNKLSDVVVTNHGPGDVYELHATAAEGDDLVRDSDDEVIPRLPQGKSVRVLRRMPPSFSQVKRPYFSITLHGKTADGVAFDQEEFVSGS